MNNETPKTKKTVKLRKLKTPLLILLIIGGLAGTAYFYQQYQNAKANPEEVAQAEARKIEDKAGQLISLPDETPTLATVNDKEKLKDQPFFAEAKNGDKLLIYTEAKKAVIYRPGDHFIVNVGPLVLSTGNQTPETE